MFAGSTLQRVWRPLVGTVAALACVAAPAGLKRAHAPVISVAHAAPVALTYTNPLQAAVPSGGVVQSCADPSIIHAQGPGDTSWYVYCTSDALNDKDKLLNGSYALHLLPILKSPDLVHWTYQGDVFTDRPGWVKADAPLWAPDIHLFNGTYYLYYATPNTSLPGGGAAIGVATSSSPAGPWTDSGAPVVEPHAPPCCPDAKMWTFDPAVVEDNGQKYIFYGSFYGGIQGRKLSADGLHSDPASQTQITIDNRYEAPWLWKHGGYWYLFASAANCCAGPLTGYSVFVGRSSNLLGPYADSEGRSLLDARVGGTPVISMNGNRFVGPGHNAIFTDAGGQDWFLYHAVNRDDPYFAGTTDYTKRPLLMDPLDWVDGWPAVRGGLWASDTPQPAPAAQPGDTTQYRMTAASVDVPGSKIGSLSDEFNGRKMRKGWAWVRKPLPSQVQLSHGTLRWVTQSADLYKDTNNASVLTEHVPTGNYLVEVKVRLNTPADTSCCYNFVQAGMVIYRTDDDFIKLVNFSNWDTRQTEYAREIPTDVRYGNTVVGPPGTWTWLRIVKTAQGNQELYRAYTSDDGKTWERGGVWTARFGSSARIGLVGMGGIALANFDYVRVYRLKS